MPTDAFDDADELEVHAFDASDADIASTLESLIRADLCGARPGAVVAAIRDAAPQDRFQLMLDLADALRDDDLVSWIEADSTRRERAVAIARTLAPRDPADAHNAAAVASVRRFDEWDGYEYRLLIVPGYTPVGETVARGGVHDVARRRLEMALEDHRAGRAPFILVSGANVYPRGTPYYEAIEMKDALCAMGAPSDRIIVEARARHTTTNLRNAGRFMRAHGMSKALIVTKGGGVGGSDFFGQDFYLQNASLSTFHVRCQKELGYTVGELRGAGVGRIEFQASPQVERISYRDPLDP